MSGLKEYAVEINGVKTTLRLSDADAKASGLIADAPAASAEPVKAPAKKAAPRAANKARTASNK